MQYEERLVQTLRQHEEIMQDLRIVRSLELPDCYIGAGYIRNYIWDVLHGFTRRPGCTCATETCRITRLKMHCAFGLSK